MKPWAWLSSFNFYRLSLKGIIWLGTVFLIANVAANPVPVPGGAMGATVLPPQGSTVIINQTAPKAIINWQSFNINKGETTHFQQPAGGVALNRINPAQGPSSIYGRLTATGQIILINPAGLFFGPSAFVNVGEIIASTANISDQNFLNSRYGGVDTYRFEKVPGYNGSIINQGSIIAANHGLVALVGSNVTNEGLIQANLGHVVLGTGDAFTLSFAGNDLISFSVDARSSAGGRISNRGTLQADGGTVMVTARAAQGVLDNVINMEGVAQARSVGMKNGEIILSGDPDTGVVRLAGRLDVGGKDAQQRGGNINITGRNVLIDSPAVIEASGDAGGGNINIGGNYQGKGPLVHAKTTVMKPDSIILADATTRGNGGNIVLWSDNMTKASGNFSAKGGRLGGDGGLIETSGSHIDINHVSINTTAPHGVSGTWLIDPTDVTISSSSDSNATYNAGTYQPTNGASAASIINVGNLITQLGLTNVTVTTTPVSGSGGAGFGDITVANAISWNSPYTLTLAAANKIFLNADITAPAGGLTLNAINSSQSITSGTEAAPSATGVTAAIKVGNFNITQGQWYQVNNPLPTFTVYNNFQLNSGNIPVSTVQFVRAIQGSGATNNPYFINDVYGLQGVGSSLTMLGLSYRLAGNIDATGTQLWNNGAGFVPIGAGIVGQQFTGIFQGNGGASNTISNLYINRPSLDSVGLFGNITGGTTQNFEILNANFTGLGHVGVLTGWDNGTISNINATGTLTANGGNTNVSVGGLVGYFAGTMNNSYAGVNVTSNDQYVGGLVGYNDGVINNSYSTGSVTGGAGGSYVGGLIGNLNSNTITNTYSSGLVSVSGSTTNFGGLLGGNTGAVVNSFWDKTTSNQNTSAGAANGGTGAAGYMGLTTAQMKDRTSFVTGSSFVSGAGWSINSTPSTSSVLNAGTWQIFQGSTRPMLAAEWTTSPNTPHQLQLMGMALGAAYAVTDNINMTNTQTSSGDVWAGSGFSPVGNLSTPFTGNFVGQGYTIRNLYINQPASNFIGLIGIASGGTLGFVNLVDANITGLAGVGTLLGIAENNATILNTTATGSITSSSGFLGGLVGQIESGSAVSNSYTNVALSGTSFLGGITGENGGSISNSYSTGSVTGSGSNIGGLVGTLDSSGSITNSYSTGLVSGSSSVGGLIGLNNSGTVTNSFWDKITSNQNTSAGAANGGVGAAGYIGMTTSQMMNIANFTAGSSFISGTPWTITQTPSTTASAPSGTWFIFNGSTRPLLLTEWNTNVNTPHQLQLMGSTLGASYTLGTNVDLTSIKTPAEIWGNSSTGFVPIGTNSTAFTGSLNGNNYAISNLYINVPAFTSDVGLFSHAVGATFINTGVTNASVTGSNGVLSDGIFAGFSSNTIASNIYVANSTLTQPSTGTIGGLIANFSGVLTNSYASNITLNSSSSGFQTGGLMGYNGGYLSNDYITGTLTTSGFLYQMGGLVGTNDTGATIANSYSMAAINNSATSTNLGGLVGWNKGSIINSYNAGLVNNTGSGTVAGGLIGSNTGTVTNSY